MIYGETLELQDNKLATLNGGILYIIELGGSEYSKQDGKEKITAYSDWCDKLICLVNAIAYHVTDDLVCIIVKF